MLFEDPNLRRLMYIRFADDRIIGIRGTAQDAKEIKKQQNKQNKQKLQKI